MRTHSMATQARRHDGAAAAAPSPLNARRPATTRAVELLALLVASVAVMAQGEDYVVIAAYVSSRTP